MNRAEDHNNNNENNSVVDSFCVDYRDDKNNEIRKQSQEDIKLNPEPLTVNSSEDLFLEDFENKSSADEKIYRQKKSYYNWTNGEGSDAFEHENGKENNLGVDLGVVKDKERKKPKIFKGIILSFIALFMVFLFVYMADKNTIFKNDLHKYDSFIMPVVMQDPTEFSDITKADSQMILEASIWNTILSKPTNYYNEFDDSGRSIIPFSDVYDSCKALFGSDFCLKMEKPKNETFFDLDIASQKLHVTPKGNNNCYMPYTQKEEARGDCIILTISCVPPKNTCTKDDNVSLNNPIEKKMQYTLKKDSKTQKYYISSIVNV